MEFVNRKSELAHLEDEYRDNRAKLIIIYGRRRVGKTRLIEEFVRMKPTKVYYLAAQESDTQQIEEFRDVLNVMLQDDFLARTRFNDWKHLFSYLEKVWPREKRIILAIDEATYIIKSNSSFTSYLQKFWDTFLSKTKTFLILSGSLVNLMVRDVLSHQSPLYGRRTSQIKVEPLAFQESRKFMKHHRFQDQVTLYAITGGVPKYLSLISSGEKPADFIIKKCFSSEGFFYQEGLFLLSQEFKEPSTYLNILKAIAFGQAKINDIANFCGIEGKKVSSYIDILLELGFITKIVPATEKKRTFRGAIYALNDNFLNFWYQFILPGRSRIELGEGQSLYQEKKLEITAFIGRKFEDICRQFLKKNRPQYQEIGNWWGFYRTAAGERKEVEIDICALEPTKKELLVGECKWSDDIDAEELWNRIREKTWPLVGQKTGWKVHFVLFARSFREKEKVAQKLRSENVSLFDLQDLENEMN